LYAALNLQSGEVIGSLHQRHRAVEFLKFLKRIDENVPAHLDVHLVLDNASSHKTHRSDAGSRRTRGFTCTSPQPRARGSTSSSGGSATSPPSYCAVVRTALSTR
jgi:hypothetical protein